MHLPKSISFVSAIVMSTSALASTQSTIQPTSQERFINSALRLTPCSPNWILNQAAAPDFGPFSAEAESANSCKSAEGVARGEQQSSINASSIIATGRAWIDVQHPSADYTIGAASSSRLNVQFNLTKPVRYVLNASAHAAMAGSADLVIGHLYLWQQDNQVIFGHEVWSENVELAQMGPLQPGAYALALAAEASIHYQYAPPVASGEASFDLHLLFQTPGDVNGDGVVNVNDLLQVINHWGQCVSDACASDMAPWPSGDGIVNVNDLLAVINAWGP